MWKKQTATKPTAVKSASGDDGNGRLAPEDITAYALELRQTAGALEADAPFFAPDVAISARIRASERMATVMQRHGHQTRLFARSMAADSVLAPLRAAWAKKKAG